MAPNQLVALHHEPGHARQARLRLFEELVQETNLLRKRIHMGATLPHNDKRHSVFGE